MTLSRPALSDFEAFQAWRADRSRWLAVAWLLRTADRCDHCGSAARAAGRRRAGRIVEQGRSEQVLGNPQDAYTRELPTAIPHPPLPVQ
jgi:hypothetical protein